MIGETLSQIPSNKKGVNDLLRLINGIIFTTVSGFMLIAAITVFAVGQASKYAAVNGTITINERELYGQEAIDAAAEISRTSGYISLGILVFALIFGGIGISLFVSYNRSQKAGRQAMTQPNGYYMQGPNSYQ